MKWLIPVTAVAQALAAPGHHFGTLVNNGGDVKDAGAYPSFADIRDASGKTICGGSLLAKEDFDGGVLTAASCFFDAEGNMMNVAALQVALGSVSRDGPTLRVASVEPHPLYNQATKAFNVALVRLAGNVPADAEGLSLAEAERRDPGTAVSFVGFGDKYADGGVANTLRHTGEPTGHDFRVLGWGHYECKPHLAKLGLDYPECSALCIKQLTPGGPCHNDVGGPVLASGPSGPVLAGLTSADGDCGKEGRVVLATDVASPAVQAWLECLKAGRGAARCSAAATDSDTCKAPGTSSKTCGELGWEADEAGVCASSAVLETKTGQTVCSLKHTFEEAQGICRNLGARLCRTAELEADVAQGSGCGLDGERVWTTDPCFRPYTRNVDPTPDRIMTAGGSSSAGMRARCKATEHANMYAVRCCADATVEEASREAALPSLQVAEDSTASRQTCAQLGWATTGHPDVCTSPKSLYASACPADMTRFEAGEYCAQSGARLCSLSEVLMGAPAIDEVCGMHAKRTWITDGCLDGETSVAGSAGFEPTFPLSCSPVDSVVLPPLCCADVVSPNANARSTLSCSELKWSLAPGGALCATSRPQGSCGLAMTLADAALACGDAGGRLCSTHELLADVAANSGCGLDGKRVWTSDACEGGAFTTAGSSKAGDTIPRQCSLSYSKAQVRCCGDVEVAMPGDNDYWAHTLYK